MSSLFISYRRSDSQDITDRIYDRLAARFGSKNVFKDTQSISGGAEFRQDINAALSRCQVLIAVIGPTWLTVQDEAGHRRLDDTDDLVRREIETALNREGMRVIPLLVNGAGLPDAAALPDSLKPLRDYNGFTIHPELGFHPSLDRLIEELETFLSTQPNSTTPENLPKNVAPVFVGREQALADLHAQLQQHEVVAITAIQGMGGIGKTELALQYADRYGHEYPAGLCWLSARELNVGTELVNFAKEYLSLRLSEKDDLATQVSSCWRHWPQTRPGDRALIIYDDVTEYEQIKDYLPPRHSRQFQVLFTTRRQRLARNITDYRLALLTPAASLDLMRAIVGADRIETEREAAEALCEWVGYLPLGLELISNHLDEFDVTLTELHKRLKEKRVADIALEETYDGMTATRGVIEAFELSWQTLDETAQRLACWLGLFALAPIAWELAANLAKEDEQETLSYVRDKQLVKRSLLQRIAPKTYQLHQLLREFFLAKLAERADSDELKQTYCRSMVKKSSQMPQTPTQAVILAMTPVMPHIETAATDWQDALGDEENELLWPFVALARFYVGQGAYAQAEPWYQNCLSATQQRFGDSHPDVATSLNNLAGLYESQGRYEAAEPLYQQALAMRQRLLGDSHPAVATSLNNLAGLYLSQGRYEDAEPLYQQALAMLQRLLGDSHPAVATSLNNLAALYRSQGRYEAAEPLYQQALAMRQRLLGDSHPDVATSLNNLAALYESQGRYEAAEPLYQQAIQIDLEALGENHPDFVINLANLAGLYVTQNRFSEAEPLYLHALGVFYARLGAEHPYTKGTFRALQHLITQAIQSDQADTLSDHAMTQDLLRDFLAQQGGRDE
ncbi:MAG: tetratricopeptide repeat protein [Leptolyngbya sp. SIO4C1]|nr:tetratricopeptide repeat protein [Leptolyngbya sp. SIO4C1]